MSDSRRPHEMDYVAKPNIRAPHVPDMSLRDYFAAMALTRFNAAYCAENDVDYNEMCKYCYTIADTMLKAREAK